MKAYKVEILVIDKDDVGPGQIRRSLEADESFQADVLLMKEADIGDYEDDDNHPLKNKLQFADEYRRLFKD